jgi:hypothetical protein
MAIPFIFRSEYEKECFFDGEEPEGAAPVERASRRQRKPSVDKLIAKAKAAGATSVMVEGVEMRFGEPGAAPKSTDPWQADLERWKQ